MIDTATNKVIETVSVGDGPVGVAITPGGDRAYVANGLGGSVSVIAVDTEPTVAGTPAAGVIGEFFSYAFTVTGRPAPTVTATAGTLPDGLTLTEDGVLSGTPTTAGRFEFTLTATNGVNPDAVLPVVLEIADTTSSPAGSLGSFGAVTWTS
ncbi:YncE family protein [Prescottella equi]|uniref:YncE family protein n=1 Tax=Rhodococcus hoagii TaxID=43767 RepID=UPI0007CD4671|nr:putative Ig domain-containing protein [Prescottella equi]